jgi:hypothetical protein
MKDARKMQDNKCTGANCRFLEAIVSPNPSLLSSSWPLSTDQAQAQAEHRAHADAYAHADAHTHARTREHHARRLATSGVGHAGA